MPYWQLFYHIITATKDRKPLLIPSIEPEIYRLIKEKCYDLGGDLYALNGIVDHIHMVVAIPPKLAVANFIGQVKGYSSSQFNQNGHYSEPFLWQEEYGVFSFDKKRLPNYIDYVACQKEHHRNGGVIPVLESVYDTHGKKVAEEVGEYTVDSTLDAW